MSDSIISFAAFILADAGLEVTSDNLLAITKAAGANVDNVCTSTRQFHCVWLRKKDWKTNQL